MSPHLLLLCAAALSIFFTLLWVQSVRLQKASHVDVGWAVGLGALGIVAAVFGTGDTSRRMLLGAMTTIWSLRLSLHLYFDRVRGKPEDGRYTTLRNSWGKAANRNFFLFFQAQALLDLILAIPFFITAARLEALSMMDLAACLLLSISVWGENSADRTLAIFRADPGNQGRVCRRGLWAWSRHPNYFFEWLAWIAFAALAPADWRSWVSPTIMLYFLFRLTGIPATEAQALKSRGEEYRRYQDEVSVFIPLPPQKASIS